MAIESFENNLIKYEQLVQEKFNVRNPYLLKTGTLGTLINILAFQEYDVADYYNKVLQELNPALARDFNSMLFHASFYGIDIELAKPATFSVYIQIPEINTDNNLYYEYIIPANTAFKDTNGLPYIIEDQITITQSQARVKAYSYSNENGKKELNIIQTTDDRGNKIYLIQYNNVKQYERLFYKFIVPYYDIGTSFYFDIGIPNYKKLKSINVWLNENPATNFINPQKLAEFKTYEIAQSFKLLPMNVKYYEFGSSRFDPDIFVDIKETTLSFKTGNGINGLYLKENSELIVEVDLSEGEFGNLENMEFTLENVLVKSVDLDKKESYFKTIINGFSVDGGQGGESVEAVDSIRNKIFDQIRLRNSIVTESDFEIAFKYNDISPFVDAKFIDNQSIVFLFNVLKYKEKIIETTALNLTETQIANNPFYPVINYNGKDLISPFYYKKLNNNVTQAYIVKPKIDIPLFTSSSVDPILRIDNEVQLSIEYDFNKRKSYIKLYNTKEDYTYRVRCNQFSVTLNYGNLFTYEVDSQYTDSFCIIKDYLYDFEVDIIDNNGVKLFTMYNYKSDDTIYHQLELKQEIYKYYVDIPPQDFDIPETTVAMDYLENQLAEIINTVESLYTPIQEGELPYLLRLPFINKEFYDEIDYDTMYSLIDEFFIVNENKDKLSITSKVQQSFYNTIDIEQQYLPYLFKQNNVAITSPKIPIKLNLNINKENLFLSKYQSVYDLEFDIKLKIIEFLSKYEGFQVSFYESEIEDYLYNQYNTDIQLIKNIEFISPKLFIVNDPDQIYYQINKDLGIEELIKFVPPYFYYDYDNIEINITYS